MKAKWSLLKRSYNLLTRFAIRIFICFCIPINCFSQFHNFNYIAPPPDAASFHKYTEVPVSHFSGVPNISVDMYTIQLKTLSIPINLSYHAGGFKVEEVSGNSGLGWTVTGGGNITASIAGFYDLKGGFPYTFKIPQNRELNPLLGTDDYELCMTLAGGRRGGQPLWIKRNEHDTEPDIFYYSYPGNSGKFVFDQAGKVHLIPYDTIKLERIRDSTFTITDKGGNIFEFEQLEEVKAEIKEHTYDNQLAAEAYTVFNYTFYLKKITTPYGEVVEYHYDKPIEYSYISSIKHNRYNRKVYQYGCQDIVGRKIVTTNFVTSRLLTSIKSNRGHSIDFIYSPCDRLDLPGSFALERINVSNGDLARSFVFSYGYFGLSNYNGECGSIDISKSDNYRLKLLSVMELGKPAYTFSYYEGYSLPNRFSTSQDAYGFFNGKPNSSLLPKHMAKGFMDGGDRSSSFPEMKACILEKITYPTGGFAKFVFEPNDLFTYSEVKEENKRKSYYYGDVRTRQTFTIGGVGRSASAFKVKYNGISGNASPQMTFTLKGPSNYLRIFYGISDWQNLDLPPGSYELTVNRVGEYEDGYFILDWVESYQEQVNTNRIIGGIRVKEIKHYDFTGNNISNRFYEYNEVNDSTRSSGKILFRPEFTYDYYFNKFDESNNAEGSCSYYAQSSSSNIPLSGVQGSHIGYTTVTEYYDSLKDKGHIVYNFTFRDDIANERGFPFVPPLSFDFVRGRPSSTVYYKFDAENRSSIKVKEEKYFYKDLFTEPTGSLYWNPQQIKEKHVLGLKIHIIREEKYVNTGGLPYTSPALFAIYPIKIISSWSFLERKEVYDYATNNYRLTTTNYYYDSKDIQLDSIVTDNSEGYFIERYTTPGDYPSIGSGSFITRLKAKHILNAPIENTKLQRKGSLDYIIDSRFITYRQFEGSLLPQYEYVLDNDRNRTFDLIDVFKINTSGNPVFDNDYKIYNEFSYDRNSNINSVKDERHGKFHNIVWDETRGYQLAYAQSGLDLDMAYTSFETEQKGNWNFIGHINSDNSRTGAKCYKSSQPISYRISKPGSYVISLWAKIDNVNEGNNTIAVNGYSSSVPVGDWNLLTWNFDLQAGQTVTITPGINLLIDEVRLHGKDVLMKSFTYKNGYGISSSTDENHITTYYEYDTAGRLTLIRDHKKNIVKQFLYHYKND